MAFYAGIYNGSYKNGSVFFYKNTSKVYNFRIKAKKYFKTTLEK